MLIAILVIMACNVLWACALVDAARTPQAEFHKAASSKFEWLLIIALTWVFGAAGYLFNVRREMRSAR
jgi:hypothetical protein